MTGPITVAEQPDRSGDHLHTLLRRAISDPGAFVRRERWTDQSGIIGDWDYESVAAWGARAVVRAVSTDPAALRTLTGYDTATPLANVTIVAKYLRTQASRWTTSNISASDLTTLSQLAVAALAAAGRLLPDGEPTDA